MNRGCVRIIYIFALVIIILGGGGCDMDKAIGTSTWRKSLNDRMVAYMNERYDDTFTFEILLNIGRETRKISVLSKKFPEDKIRVLYWKTDEGEFFNDDYHHFLFKQQTITKLNEVLTEAFEHDFKMFYNSNIYVGIITMPADITFKEYIANKSSQINFNAVLAPGYDFSDQDAVVNKLRNTLTSHNIKILSASIIFSDDEDEYESLDRSKYSWYSARYTGFCLYILNSGTEKEKIGWIY